MGKKNGFAGKRDRRRWANGFLNKVATQLVFELSAGNRRVFKKEIV
jgi:hypothetical protein